MDSTVYELTWGDDIRTVTIKLSSSQNPTSAKLILKDKNGAVRLERDMTGAGLEWSYRFTDADFTALTQAGAVKIYRAQAYATFADATNGTYPTGDPLTVVVYPKL